MNRPLIICDCDEVLLHMVAHFKQWLEEEEGIDFQLEGASFSEALRWQKSGELLEQTDIWRMLGLFFDTQMHRQTPIAGAVDAIATLSDHAEVVILTNLVDERRERRAQQLAQFGINAQVYTNQGPKGPALARIIERHDPSHAIFIDDLSQHHASVKEVSPKTIRLHMCGEPMIADHIECAHKRGFADARMDEWGAAVPWLIERIEEDRP
ncbi:MAG: HAD family hydrolase [Erythrobacter sp.]|jgi:hypothetical protein|nr:HAD family hydrolase [Erythrobacter sp.]